jgi:hypothetical protein
MSSPTTHLASQNAMKRSSSGGSQCPGTQQWLDREPHADPDRDVLGHPVKREVAGGQQPAHRHFHPAGRLGQGHASHSGQGGQDARRRDVNIIIIITIITSNTYGRTWLSEAVAVLTSSETVAV